MSMVIRGEHWTIDRKIPLAMVIGLAIGFVVQTVVLVSVGTAWKTAVDNRLFILEKNDHARNGHGDRIIVLEQAIPYIRADLTEIKALLKEQRRAK